MINSNLKFAIIDDDTDWLKIIHEKLQIEFKNKIDSFDDFENFYKFEDFNQYDVIIMDYYFNCYNLDSIDVTNILKYYKGKKILLTGNPNAVIKKDIFTRIINKSYVVKPTFKFSKIII